MNRHGLLAAALIIAITTAAVPANAAKDKSVPLIHCTDLLYPPDDPDDYFDLASVYAVPEFDLKAVILDQGEKQKDRNGTVGVEQLNRITGQSVKAAIGLSQKLKSVDDKGLDQPQESQSGIETMLRILQESPIPIVISVVGSARDITAAFNREPELFRSKVSRVYVFAGEASNPNFVEWNVSMDPLAYAGLMRSGLPIVWIPCFDGGDWTNHAHASFWRTTHRDLLAGAPDSLTQYFISATQQVTSHPLEFVNKPVQAAHRTELFAATRNMWGGALLAIMAGREIKKNPKGGYEAIVTQEERDTRTSASAELIDFPYVRVSFTDGGAASYDGDDAQNMRRMRVTNKELYGPAMTSATAALLARFPEARQSARYGK